MWKRALAIWGPLSTYMQMWAKGARLMPCQAIFWRMLDNKWRRPRPPCVRPLFCGDRPLIHS